VAVTRNAAAHWEGSLFEGKGRVSFNSSHLGEFDVTWAARSAEPNGVTSPEELIAAAHSTCFSMALSHALSQNGTPPTTVDTSAEVEVRIAQHVVGNNIADGSGTHAVSCTGTLQTVNVNVAAQRWAFVDGVAFARGAFTVCDRSGCRSETDEREIPIVG